MQKVSLSAFMDGEELSNHFMQKLEQDENLQKSWQNYHLIRSVMREESEVFLGADFTQNLADAIENEPQVTLVEQPRMQEMQEETRPSFWHKLKGHFVPLVQLGVAASVCFVAVLGVQNYNKKAAVSELPVLQTLPFNQSVQDVSYTVPNQIVVTPEQVQQKNQRIGDMMQHYELQRRLYSGAENLQP